MVKNKYKKSVVRQYAFDFRHRHFKVLLDKILIFRLFRKLHGRFWGLTGALGLGFGIAVCFLIRPDMLKVSTAFSDFGMDVRTAPYFWGRFFLRHTVYGAGVTI